tara:strand:+ start:188 stop:343 length:156 start_codon:yes stop_codon:yes gene_type:complete
MQELLIEVINILNNLSCATSRKDSQEQLYRYLIDKQLLDEIEGLGVGLNDI